MLGPTRLHRRRSRMNPLLAFSTELAAAVERAGRSVVAVNARPRLPSTGVHWRPGIIVTAHHAVRAEQDITITLAGGRTVPATLAGRDPGTDIAALRVDAADLPVADLATTALQVGHVVIALGHGPRASWGIVSALGGRWRTWRGGEVDQFVRLDVTLYPGFSGGPLVDVEGRVLGIATSGLDRRLELALPAATVSRVADELLDKGRVSRGFLGVGLQPVRLPESARSALSVPAEIGLIVVGLEPDGPAAKAGLLLGDIVVALDGRVMMSPDDVQAEVGAQRAGTVLRITLLRAGAPMDVSVTLGERP